MKLFLLSLISLFMFNAWSFYPMSGEAGHELRLIAKAGANNWKNPSIEGQIASIKVNEKFLFGGVFSLGEVESNVALQTTYSVNKYIDVSGSGKVNNLKDFGAELMVNANVYYKNHLIKPFIKTDHKVLTEAGVVYYFSLDQTAFHVGLSVKSSDEKFYKVNGGALFFGAGIDADAKLGGLFGKVSEGV